MQRIDNLYVSELEFDDSGIRGPKGESGDSPSLYIEKIADYIYKAEARNPDYHQAEMFVREHYPNDDGACASIRKGNLFGHNYDRRYDKTAEFFMRSPAKGGVHASIGVAAIPGVLTVDMVDAPEPDELTEKAYEVLPYFMLDGINDMGVAVSMHFMQYNNDPQPDDDSAVCSLFAVKYLLDNADSADDAVRLLRMKEFWSPMSDLVKYGIYLMIADREKSYIADLYGNRELCEDDKIPLLSNFRKIGWDGTKQTLEPYANGLERYQIMADAYESVEDMDDMIDLLKSVWYTGVYDEEKEDFWLSDYNGDWTEFGYGDLTIDSDVDDYEAIVLYATNKFKTRVRDGGTMQTVHTVVYDIDKLTATLLVQETDKEYKFAMDELNLLFNEIERAKEAEASIREDCANMFYTKPEVDGALYDLNESLTAAISETSESITQETDQKLANKVDAPETDGSAGQVLFKTDDGTAWENLPAQLPEITEEDNDKVLTVENGSWVASDKFADYIRYCNITVTITSDNGGVSTGGLMLTLRNADTEDLISDTEYLGQPVTFRVPRGMHFSVTPSGVWEGYHNPTPSSVDGISNNDVSIIFTYEAVKVPTTLRELQIIVNDGNAPSLANHIGLQFEDVYTENGTEYNIIWDLKDVHDVFDETGQRHTGVFLEWHHCTPTAMPFDAPERVQVDLNQSPYAEEGLYYYGLTGSTYALIDVATGSMLPTTYDAIYVNSILSPDASIIRRGYGRYSDSVPRKWLNSDAEAGAWFTPSHVGDAAPAQAETIAGFKKGCSEQILSMVKPVIIETASAANTNYQLCDEFFIPSVTEVYGIQDNVTEGSAWLDWVDATGFSAPGNGATNGRRIYMPETITSYKTGLRSANVGYQYIVWDISTDGSLDGYANASTLRRFSPCCVIYK